MISGNTPEERHEWLEMRRTPWLERETVVQLGELAIASDEPEETDDE